MQYVAACTAARRSFSAASLTCFGGFGFLGSSCFSGMAAGAGADGKGPTAANSVHDKWWFWTVIGLAVAGGTATALAFTLDRGQGGPSADTTLTIP